MYEASEQVILKCKQCGVELTEDNSYERADGVSCDCADCEQAFYDKLAEQMGFSLALYLCCVRYNVPCEPMLIPDTFKEKDFEGHEARWLWYLDTLIGSDKYLAKDGTIRGFSDGVKSMFRIFGKEMSEKDFSRYCLTERETLEKLPGTVEQRERWGMLDIWSGLPVSASVYNDLDRAYETMRSRYRGITIDETMDATLKRIVKLRMAQDYLQSKGDAASFDKVQKSIDSILASEQLRKKDEKPVETLRIDALVLALEKAGLMESGELLTYDELLEVLPDKFMRKKKYGYSADVGDQVILDIINCMRQNADLPPIQDLPEEFAVVDEHGEFEPEETEREKENKRFLGITKVNVVKSDKGDK